jgi:hypothetical protein
MIQKNMATNDHQDDDREEVVGWTLFICMGVFKANIMSAYVLPGIVTAC